MKNRHTFMKKFLTPVLSCLSNNNIYLCCHTYLSSFICFAALLHFGFNKIFIRSFCDCLAYFRSFFQKTFFCCINKAQDIFSFFKTNVFSLERIFKSQILMTFSAAKKLSINLQTILKCKANSKCLNNSNVSCLAYFKPQLYLKSVTSFYQ